MGFVSLNLATYAVTRRARGSFDGAGRAVAGLSSSFNISANQQPANGTELKAIPEHRRNEDVRVLYTTTEILSTNNPGYEPDRIAIGTGTYEVWKVEEWPRHFRVYASRIDNP